MGYDKGKVIKNIRTTKRNNALSGGMLKVGAKEFCADLDRDRMVNYESCFKYLFNNINHLIDDIEEYTPFNSQDRFRIDQLAENLNLFKKGSTGFVVKGIVDFVVKIPLILGVSNVNSYDYYFEGILDSRDQFYHYANSAIEELVEEYETLKSLNHDNIIKTYGAQLKIFSAENNNLNDPASFLDSNKLYLERCDGTLENILEINVDTNNYVQVCNDIFYMVTQVFDATMYMISKNIFHLDFKPVNIFYKLKNGKYIIKIGDLGIAVNTSKKSIGSNISPGNAAFALQTRNPLFDYTTVTTHSRQTLCLYVLHSLLLLAFILISKNVDADGENRGQLRFNLTIPVEDHDAYVAELTQLDTFLQNNIHRIVANDIGHGENIDKTKNTVAALLLDIGKNLLLLKYETNEIRDGVYTVNEANIGNYVIEKKVVVSHIFENIKNYLSDIEYHVDIPSISHENVCRVISKNFRYDDHQKYFVCSEYTNDAIYNILSSISHYSYLYDKTVENQNIAPILDENRIRGGNSAVFLVSSHIITKFIIPYDGMPFIYYSMHINDMRKEYENLLQLDNNNIIKTYGFSTLTNVNSITDLLKNRLFLEKCDGTLEEFNNIRFENRQDFIATYRIIIEMAQQFLNATIYFVSVKKAHVDIKLNNIFYVEKDGLYTVKVGDLGVVMDMRPGFERIEIGNADHTMVTIPSTIVNKQAQNLTTPERNIAVNTTFSNFIYASITVVLELLLNNVDIFMFGPGSRPHYFNFMRSDEDSIRAQFNIDNASEYIIDNNLLPRGSMAYRLKKDILNLVSKVMISLLNFNSYIRTVLDSDLESETKIVDMSLLMINNLKTRLIKILDRLN